MKENQQNHLISACGTTIPIFGPPLVTTVFDTLSLSLPHPTINAPPSLCKRPLSLFVTPKP